MTTTSNYLTQDINSIREKIPSLANLICFNCGMEGPLPEPALKSIQRSIQKYAELGTYTKETITTCYKDLHDVRLKIANFFSCKLENICLTPSASFGVNIALNAFEWGSDDEIITTSSEYPCVIYPLYNIRERYGSRIKFIDLDLNNPIKSIKNNLTSKTKAFVFSHVFWESGNKIESLKEIINELKNLNIISIIDGAQAAGAIKINLNDLCPDFYSVPGHKWLLGPKGTGFLYINERLFGNRPPWPSILGFDSGEYFSDKKSYDLDFNWSPKKNAGLFEFGGLNHALFNGLGSSLEFTMENNNKFNIFERINFMSNYLRERLNEKENIKIVTSNKHAGLISWISKKNTASEIVQILLKEKKIAVREMQGLNYIRASVHYYNTKEEIDLLIDSL